VTTYADIEEAEQAVASLKDSYLREYGWKCTCNTPGAYWLWKLDFAALDAQRLAWWETAEAETRAAGRLPPSRPHPYGVMTVDRDLAVDMTVKVLEPPAPPSEDDDDG
jgi:hypothetical protein